MEEIKSIPRKSTMKLTRRDVLRVSETISFPAEEELILQDWKLKKTFEKCMQLSKGKPK